VQDHSAHVAATVTEAAVPLNASTTLDETLDSIVRAAVQTVPGFDHAGISITLRDGTIETRAGTDQLVWDLDAIQYGLREGPGYDAIRGPTVTVVDHAAHDQRWPHYMPEAAKRGLRSQLGVGLYADEQSLGGLNLYSTSSDTVADEAVLIAELFASHAAMALGRAREVSQLNEALQTRKLIGQAIGILMERYQLDDERAFQFLIRASQQGNIKLRAVAEDLVATAIAQSRVGDAGHAGGP